MQESISGLQLFWVLALVLISLGFIVANERFSHGVPKSMLWFQVLTFLVGIWTITLQGYFLIKLLPLVYSALIGLMGFILLCVDSGPKRFTRTIRGGNLKSE